MTPSTPSPSRSVEPVAPERQYVLTQEQWTAHMRLIRLAKGWLHALYDGIPGGKPATDADMIRGVADWLDKADDVRDAYLAEHGIEGDVASRSVQEDLRRIAADLDRAAVLEQPSHGDHPRDSYSYDGCPGCEAARAALTQP